MFNPERFNPERLTLDHGAPYARTQSLGRNHDFGDGDDVASDEVDLPQDR